MRVERFLADSAADAVAQIRARLGADAVVVNVRQQPARGWGRLLRRKPRLEVLATRPEPSRLSLISDAPALPTMPLMPVMPAMAEENVPEMFRPSVAAHSWRVEAVLESLGLLPLYAARVVEELKAKHGARPPSALATQIEWARGALRRQWRTAPAAGSLHVLIGPPGAGKTTTLCKWLTRVTLLEGRSARVWRLDGQTANTSEFLELHGEILGVPVDRAWPGMKREAAVGFVDLPGIAVGDDAAMSELARWLKASGAQAHLVLNGAYDAGQLLRQAAAFCAAVPVADVIVTHLDEEPRWGKLWNLALGTDCPVRFLATGQNIPGDFIEADADVVLERLFPCFGGESKAGKAPAYWSATPREKGTTP